MYYVKKDDVVHANSGKERTNHKYVARVKTSSSGGKNKYRYFYTVAEFKAYLKGGEKTAASANSGITKTTSNTKKSSPNTNVGVKTKNAKSVNSTTKKQLSTTKKTDETDTKKVSDVAKSSTSNKTTLSSVKVSDIMKPTVKKSAATIDKNVAYEKTVKKESNVKMDKKKTVAKTADYKKEPKVVKPDKKDVKDKIEDLLSKVKKQAITVANEGVDTAKKVIDKVVTDKENMYNINSFNYKDKVKQVKESKEWKEIVKNKDPEYVKKNKDGTTTYLIDDYIVKKKHPVLDVVDDIVNGREISVNKIDKDTIAAGLIDYATSSVKSGILVATIGAKFLTEKFKFSQGSYDDDIAKLTKDIEKGAKTVQTYTDKIENIDQVAIKKVADTINTTNKAADDLKKNDYKITSDQIINATEMITSSDAVKELVRDNEKLQQVNDVVSNMTKEDVDYVIDSINKAKTIKDKTVKGDIAGLNEELQSSKELQELLKDTDVLNKIDQTVSGLTEEELELISAIVAAVKNR